MKVTYLVIRLSGGQRALHWQVWIATVPQGIYAKYSLSLWCIMKCLLRFDAMDTIEKIIDDSETSDLTKKDLKGCIQASVL